MKFKVLALENEDFKKAFNCYLLANATFTENSIDQKQVEFQLMTSQMQRDKRLPIPGDFNNKIVTGKQLDIMDNRAVTLNLRIGKKITKVKLIFADVFELK